MKTGLDILLGTDSYKMGHSLMYPDDTTHIISYFESRGGMFSNGSRTFDDIVFFGLQYFLKEYLSARISLEDVWETAAFAEEHGVPFDDKMWLRVVQENYGRLPVRIRALPEGTIVKPGMPLFTVENTMPGAHGVVSYLETELTHVWQPITVASYSWALRQTLRKYYDISGTEAETFDFRVHDFGGRGASSRESAMLGGMAHLAVGWRGTDTVVAIDGARSYYNEPMAGFSVPATEHSVMTAWGPDRELAAYTQMMSRFGKRGGIVSIVSDTYDVHNVVDNIMPQIRNTAESYGATPVVRLDSGDAIRNVLLTLDSLSSSYGYTVNDKGYHVLNGVRILQGDGVNLHAVEDILDVMTRYQWSIDNIVFGIGGALLQKHDRDTFKFAFKACGVRDGQSPDTYRPIKKQPKHGGEWKTSKGIDELDTSKFVTVFNGSISHNNDFSDIRERINS